MEILSAIIQLLGGLAMFLYGIELMGDGLKNSSGAALKRILEKVTGNVWMGVLTGALVTAVIQSSTATIVLTVALIGAGVLNLKQAVSIVMGANIGTTVTAQIIRLGSIESDGSFLLWLFDTDTLAPIALIAGIILLMFVKNKSSKPVGDICIGFGVLFVGLSLMTDGVKPLIGTDAFVTFVDFLTNPLFGILFGLVLTVIVQSSSATVGMLQTVASVPGSGITFAMAYPVIMGINLGTCVTTAMVCSIGSSKDAKRTGVVHIAFNTIGTVLFMIVMTVMQKMAIFGAEFWVATVDSGGIANFQTIFNLVTAIVLIPFADWMVKLSMLIVKEDKPTEDKHPELHTLDEKLFNSPTVAVGVTVKAVSAMGSIAKGNFEKACKVLRKYDPVLVSQINEDEEYLDQFKDSADRFLVGLSKTVETEWDDRQMDMLIQTVPSFERVGDYATNLVELADRLQSENTTFSDMAKKELDIICDAVNEILSITVEAFSMEDNEKAKAIEPLEETIDDMVMILKDRHTKRLKTGACSIGSGLVFMEALTYLERVSDHCSSIAVVMLARNNESILQNHYDYLREIHSGNDVAYLSERERRREQYIKPLKEVQ
ncbi:MAG: Na/Pi cotransporter family protein [Oscillospiraceae bacterium]|nr:Na/Pi cotransporter family protein [Oscillospiraceae bacterium]